MKTLKWIVQDNLYNEDGYQRFIGALIRQGIDYQVVKPVPFTNIVLPEDFDTTIIRDISEADGVHIDNSQPIMAFGATSLTRIAKAKGWLPGTYLNDNFHYSKWKEHYGDDLLNPDSVIGPVHSIANQHGWDHVFVRPTEDTKAISGTVMSRYDFDAWLQTISQIVGDGMMPLHRDTEIVISSVKEIWTECRLFVVNGRVVTASMYKRGDMVKGDSNVDREIINFASRMAHIWSPAHAFAIDVAVTPNGLKVIEINNINSAGFYEADVGAIIDAINTMECYGSHKELNTIYANR